MQRKLEAMLESLYMIYAMLKACFPHFPIGTAGRNEKRKINTWKI
jgi:hypothetical protein